MDIYCLCVLLAGHKRSAPMEGSPQKFPRIPTENQQSSMTPGQPAYALSFYQNPFNSSPFHAGMTHLSGSLSHFVSSQWSNPSPQQYPSLGPSRLPLQGWFCADLAFAACTFSYHYPHFVYKYNSSWL